MTVLSAKNKASLRAVLLLLLALGGPWCALHHVQPTILQPNPNQPNNTLTNPMAILVLVELKRDKFDKEVELSDRRQVRSHSCTLSVHPPPNFDPVT